VGTGRGWEKEKNNKWIQREVEKKRRRDRELNLMKIINMKTMNGLINLINADINNNNHLIYFKKNK
jgi:hypothetical protein